MLEPRNRQRRTSRRAAAHVVVIVAMLASIACERSVASVPPEQRAISDSARMDTRGDSELGFPDIPDPAKTPGLALDVTAADICVPGYSKRVRDVPAAVKRQAYAMYGVKSHEPGEYEIDHLINLSLGGSNSIKNLWPESFRTSPWNAYVKDALEVELHRRVCAGTIDLATAQHAIASNWVIGYRKYVQPTPPAFQNAQPRDRERQPAQPQPRAETPVP